MADAPITGTKTVRKPRIKKEEPVGVVSTDGKSVLPQPLQTTWLSWYGNHTEKERNLIDETLTMLTVGELNTAGYRAFFRTYRLFKSQGLVAGKPIKARF
jgi:hypothetical protein